METKDWIVLMVPILCNGIFLACFGKFIDYKIKKIEDKDKTLNEIKAEFREKVILIKKEYANLMCATRDGKTAECGELIKKITDLCGEAEVFCISRKPLLDSSFKVIGKIYDTYNDWLMHVKNPEAYTLDEQAAFHEQTWTSIGEYLDELMKENI